MKTYCFKIGGGKTKNNACHPLRFRALAISVAVLWFTGFLQSQTAVFLEESSLADSSLTQAQLTLKNMYTSSPFASSSYLVEPGDLPQIQQDGILPVHLPGILAPFEF